ncbi:MAG: glycosyltransferase family 2 protein [Candidatus Omnitrophica bacterium]|nr:glycosyltransferase family 2 protein [Candidatus Omnitrophota bacterium]
MKKYLIGICAYNEGDKIRRVMQKFCDDQLYDLLIIDDASTDGSLEKLPPQRPIVVMRNETQKGAGFGVRKILDYARDKGYAAVFFVSGNDKDDPADIVKLKNAIEKGFDLVQGSRYLPGGGYGQMPLYRRIATQYVHPVAFSIFSGKRITDSTNGFRAVRLSLLNDSRINLNQAWLNEYELEPYLFFKAIRLEYKVTEVPVTKIYPPKAEGYTKMKPFSGWWSILRPLFYLGLGIKK